MDDIFIISSTLCETRDNDDMVSKKSARGSFLHLVDESLADLLRVVVVVVVVAVVVLEGFVALSSYLDLFQISICYFFGHPAHGSRTMM